jgi:hypothetical protein
MSHVLVLVAGAASLLYARRWVRREYERVEASFQRADRRIRRRSAPRGPTPLTFDAASGTYRVSEKET